MKKNILIVHGGGPTCVINASLYGVLDEAAKYSDTGTIYGAIHGIEGVLSEKLLNLSNESREQIELLPYTPASALGSCRRKLTEEDYPRIIEVLQKYEISYFFVNGGNDSMDTCNKIQQMADRNHYDLKVVGIPKTIDNDLDLTDHCPGFGSAARFYANYTRDLWMEVQAMPLYVTILETMGRNAGWLTATASIPRYRDEPCTQLIYLPEHRLNEDRFLADVDNLLRKQKEILIVVSEGLVNENGDMLSNMGIVDGFGHPLAGGVAQVLCDKVTAKLGVKARAEKPGFIGRDTMILQSDQDREEAIAVGRRALQLAFEGKSGIMVSINRESTSPYRWSLGEVPLEKVANKEKKFPEEWITAEGNFIAPEFREYCLPLIGKPFPPYTVFDGLSKAH